MVSLGRLVHQCVLCHCLRRCLLSAVPSGQMEVDESDRYSGEVIKYSFLKYLEKNPLSQVEKENALEKGKTLIGNRPTKYVKPSLGKPGIKYKKNNKRYMFLVFLKIENTFMFLVGIKNSNTFCPNFLVKAKIISVPIKLPIKQ